MLALKRWHPMRDEGMLRFNELAGLHGEMARVFANLWGEMPAMNGAMANGGGFTPPAEVTVDENAWHVKMALPGMDPDNVEVQMTDNMLTVTGEHQMEEKGKKGTTRTEFGYGHFERVFTLPKTVNVEAVTAEFDNGMLALTLPMLEEVKPRTIEVTRGSKLFDKIADAVPS
jgi:HSP20 family protein